MKSQPTGPSIVTLPVVTLKVSAPACVKSVDVPPGPVRNWGVPVVSASPDALASESPFIEIQFGLLMIIETGLPNTSIGPARTEPRPVDVPWLTITLAGRPVRFGLGDNVPPSSGVLGIRLLLSTRPELSTLNDL